MPGPVSPASISSMGMPETIAQFPIAIVARNTAMTSRPTVYVNLPYKREFTMQIADNSLPVNMQCTIRLEYTQQVMSTPDHGDSNVDQAPLESVRSLATATRVVIDQVLGGMTFASARSAASFVSEALLRTLVDQLPGAKLVKVAVIAAPTSTSEPHIIASTALADIQEVGARQPQLSNARSPVINGQSSMAVTRQRLRENLGASVVLSGHIDSRAAYVNRDERLRVRSRSSSEFSAVARRIGCQKLGYTIDWSPKHTPNALHVNCDMVDRLIQEHAERSSLQGLDFLSTLAISTMTSLPEGALIHLFMSAGAKSLLPSGTLKLGNELIISPPRVDANVVAINGRWMIRLPSLSVDRLLKSSTSRQQVWLEMRITAHKVERMESGPSVDLALETSSVLQAIQAAITPRLLDVVANDLNDRVATQLAQVVLREHLLFPSHFQVTSMTLTLTNRQRVLGRARWSERNDTFAQSENDPAVDDSSDQGDGWHVSDQATGALGTVDDKKSSSYDEAEFEEVSGDRINERAAEHSNGDRGSRGMSLHTTKGAVFAESESDVSTPALTKATGFALMLFRVWWSTEDVTVAKDLTLDSMSTLLTTASLNGATGSIQDLVSITTSVRSALSDRPSTTLVFALKKDHVSRSQHTFKGQFRARINVDDFDERTTTTVQITLPIITGLAWGIGSLSRVCSVRLTLRSTFESDMYQFTDDVAAAQVSPTMGSLADALRPLMASYDINSSPSKLASTIASHVREEAALLWLQMPPTAIEVTLMSRSLDGKPIFGQCHSRPSVDTTPSLVTTNQESTAIIALGSNVGDRLEAIERACSAIDDGPDMRIVRTSNLYESEPMYVEDQARFLNGVCQVRTQLPPVELLDRLQAIELNLGRVKHIDKGPRNIDLDILLYNSDRFESERLTIPHQLLKEREFVLRPLDNLGLGSIEPLRASAQALLRRMETWSTPSMYSQVSLGPPQATVNTGAPKRRTQMMSILNVTPDSFSDGGVHEPTDLEALKASVSAHVVGGATVIDIGGQSSRPDAPDVTAEDEITRILPAIQAIKSLPAAEHIAISIDTYRASVAKAAIKAGAHIINDISGGLLDAEMLPTIARLGCTYIIMHMRGTPATMQNEENLRYPAGLIPTIATELKARLQAAEEAGIRRWRIILDPGIGFSKTVDQNLEILRELPALRQRADLRDMPWLIGSSRKGFVGKVTDVAEAKDRTWGTAATVTAAVQGGAEIVRVHDVAEMAQVVKMSDAIYRV
ncbi:trifunctional dihydropteroate synthetase [Recurvomyces mirabilis]|uniref:Folic acid synthesis protein FOL1 n=2 Tax=Recurvomyces mirabilis TaxID=574656 RepID=A0AAE0WUK0_9PEZI|nr:trifunctional dihydropteroate synthetase [Recurvomyces mirabilis]